MDVFLIMVVLLFLTSCADATSPPEPTHTQIPATDTDTPPPLTHTQIPPTPTLTPSPVPPTDTPTPVPPTKTPRPTKTITPTPVLLTDASYLVGTWFGPGVDGMYHLFNADGTCKAAFLLENLDSDPNVVCTYEFEDGQLVYTVVRVSEVPPCDDPVATYSVILLENGNISLKVVEDTCILRFITNAREHERVE